jgi:23S rRNA (uracil1939-C5)-methyltransferase
MAIIEEGKCRITKLSNKGLGIGKTKFGAVELPYTLPNELVSFDRHKYRSSSNCILKEIIEPSSNRTSPSCKYFGACGGCLLQHLDNNTYESFKQNLLSSALLEEGIKTTIQNLIIIPPSTRRRVNLELVKKDEKVFLGLHRFHSHQIISIDNCHVLSNALSNLLVPLKELFLQILPTQFKAELFLTQAENGIALTITCKTKFLLNYNHRKTLEQFALVYNLIQISIDADQTYQTLYELAKPYVLFDGIKVEIDSKCFLQASNISDQILSELIINYLYPHSSDLKIIDLFCGRGTYTLPLSRLFAVTGVEFDRESLDALNAACKSIDRQINLEQQNLFDNPFKTLDLDEYNYCVINPPRAGAKAQIFELSKSKVNKIVYVSCNPKTFVKDARILIDAGYDLIEITPVDQFYWNPHLEIVAYFQRKN